MHFPAISILLLTIFSFISFSSCSHYSIVPTDDAPFKSIYIHTISNQSYAPNAHILFQNQIKRAILKDNRLTLVKNPEDSDTQLFITLSNFSRNVNTRSSLDAGRFNSLNLGVRVAVSLYDNRAKAYLLKNIPLESNESLFFDPNEASVNHREMEYQVIPNITRDLTQNILHLILSDWSVSVE